MKRRLADLWGGIPKPLKIFLVASAVLIIASSIGKAEITQSESDNWVQVLFDGDDLVCYSADDFENDWANFFAFHGLDPVALVSSGPDIVDGMLGAYVTVADHPQLAYATVYVVAFLTEEHSDFDGLAMCVRALAKRPDGFEVPVDPASLGEAL